MNPDRELFIRYLRLAASALAGARNMARESFSHLEADLSDMDSGLPWVAMKAKGVAATGGS